MKYVVLSFDDGRKDFYTNAFPILKKYKLTGTLNIVTDFIGKRGLDFFDTADYECMTLDEIKECAEYGIEIASHSADHTNNIESIERSVKFLKKELGLNGKGGGKIGFASPDSSICKCNLGEYMKLLQKDIIFYIRSGNQIKRDGYGFALLYFFYKYSGSNYLFSLYNKRNIIEKNNNGQIIYPSITCNADNNIKQLAFFINAIPDGKAAIIMFHSILNPADPGWGRDKWYNSTEDFEKLCRYLVKKNVHVLTNARLSQRISGEWDE